MLQPSAFVSVRATRVGWMMTLLASTWYLPAATE
jgi:hypothetical protein